MSQAEKEIADAQVEFDRQTEVTRVLMEGMGSAHVSWWHLDEQFLY